MQKCINCGFEVTDQYCGKCGQNSTVNRITFKNTLLEIVNFVYGLNGKFPRTFRDLSLQPELVTGSVIQGNRIRYSPPIAYFFIVFGVYFLFQFLFDFDIFGYTINNNPFSGNLAENESLNDPKKLEFANEFQLVFSKYQQSLIFLSYPLYAVAGTWLYRKSEFNFMENVVINIYIHTHPMLLTVIFVPIAKFTGHYYNAFIMLAGIIYFVWSIYRIYPVKNKFWAIIKALVYYAIGFCFFIFLISIVAFTYLALKNPNP